MNSRSIRARLLVSAVSALAFGATALAGAKEPVRTVVVNTVDRSASGHLAGARASADAIQYIGCSVHTIDSAPERSDGIFRMAFCYARALNGASAFCTTYDNDVVQMLSTVQGDTRLDFRWDAAGYCTSFVTIQTSTLEPKK
jgi:hypothetical protein